MKHLLTLFMLVLIVGITSAQDDSKWPKVDPSNMDMEYFPSQVAFRNYLGEEERNMSPKMRLVYSRPVKKGRKIFGELVPFGEIWRMGANEANEITFYNAVGINGKTVERGTYTVFSKVANDNWSVYFSTQKGMWGSKGFDPALIAASITVPTSKVDSEQEALSMTFQEIDDKTVHLVVQWDMTQVAVPIKLNPIEFSTIDKSPMDKAHYPAKSAYTNYLEGAEKDIKPKIQVTYSRPYKNGRNIFGELLKEGDVWRIGANQSTEVLFYEDVTIAGTALKSGRYAMYAKLNGATWDIIFSKDIPAWGSANRDESKDVATVTIKTSTGSEMLENLAIIFEEKSEKLVHMVIGWDKTRAEIPVTFK